MMSIDTTPLLRMLTDEPGEMLSRTYLNSRGIADEVIEEADCDGDVIVSCNGPLASVLLTVDGEKTLAERDASRAARG